MTLGRSDILHIAGFRRFLHPPALSEAEQAEGRPKLSFPRRRQPIPFQIMVHLPGARCNSQVGWASATAVVVVGPGVRNPAYAADIMVRIVAKGKEKSPDSLIS